MRDKRLVIIMSICMLFGVFMAACVCLPGKAGMEREKEAIQAEFYDESDNGELSDIILSDSNLKQISTSDYTIVIDSGHGGSDPGKTKGDVLEKDINLAIALKLEKTLKQLGFNTIMTRTQDEGLYVSTDTNKKRADLKKRCDIANSSNADMMISIHQNSFESSNVSGAQVFYYTYSAKGKQLAGILQQSLKDNLDTSNKRVEKQDKTYYLLVHSKIPTVIVECGFLTNQTELQLLLNEEYQQKIVDSIIVGINKYFAS